MPSSRVLTPARRRPAPHSSRLVVLNHASTNQTFYVDSAQLEEGSSIGSYFDGSSPGSRWGGGNNNSTSVQDGPFDNGTARTFEGWAKRDDETNMATLFSGTSDQAAPNLKLGGHFGSIVTPPNDVTWSPGGGSAVTWSNAWPGTGKWVHWALVADEPADTAELFINGESQGVKATTGTYIANAGAFRAGNWGAHGGIYGLGLNGQMDEVAVYDHAVPLAISRRTTWRVPPASVGPT